jgi:hypothetical protein
MKYHRLKQIKYLWLNSEDAQIVETRAGTHNVEYQWTNLRHLNLSNNAMVSVCGFQTAAALDTGKSGVIRCKNIPSNQCVSSTSGVYPVIHLAKSPLTSNTDMEPIKYNIGQADNWSTVNLVFGTIADPKHGLIAASQKFIIGLKFEDYDIDEVQPQLMETVRRTDHLTQDSLATKFR